jgi:hypothetical protein
MLVVVSFIDNLERTDELFNRQSILVHQALNRPTQLLLRLRSDKKELEDDHFLVEWVAEDLQVVGASLESHREVVDRLPGMELDLLIVFFGATGRSSSF